MKRMKELIFVAFIFPILLSAQTFPKIDPQFEYEKLATLLNQGTVAKVKVLHVSDSTETRVPINKKDLRSIATSNLDFNDHIAERFGALFSGVSVKKENHIPSLYWEVILYDTRGKEIGSLFIDQFGEHGYVSDVTVSFRARPPASNLAKFLHKITNIKD
jgi:hypothetical protein